MSFSVNGRINKGAYDLPFSGVGCEFEPLGSTDFGLLTVIHECGYLSNNQKWDFTDYFSPFWRLYFNFTPGHLLHFKNQNITLTKENIFILPPRQVFSTSGDIPVKHFWITFSVENQAIPKPSIPYFKIPAGNLEKEIIAELSQIINKLTPKEQEAGAPGVPRLKALCHALLDTVLIHPSVIWEKTIPENIKKITIHIEENIQDQLNTKKLAALAQVSPETLFLKFKKYFNISPKGWVRQTRIRKAVHLLISSGTSIAEIAQICGFPNRNYFTRVFIKECGDPPAAFRQKYTV
jgi:AraC-like DNA-binding protein